ncbi:Flavin prenyltransferase UbiX [hydrothermal vent metagenome]|uniref:flavin prenyltransferase n=1 Tax=hydrothermal vent metagenome TaxID=652676 RepID=A0A3B0YSQ8_9ZZZZ
MVNNSNQSISLAITGASGVLYGLRLLECLIQAGETVFLMISQAAQVVIATETDLKLISRPAELQQQLAARYGAKEGQLQVFGKTQWMAPVASGSNAPRAMVVCPCSTGTLSAIATGASNNLIERAADVMLKEQKKLILVTREMPLSAIHLENMLKLSRLGCLIMPASPGFYHRPTEINDLIDFVVARILDQLHIQQKLMPRWSEDYNG